MIAINMDNEVLFLNNLIELLATRHEHDAIVLLRICCIVIKRTKSMPTILLMVCEYYPYFLYNDKKVISRRFNVTTLTLIYVSR